MRENEAEKIQKYQDPVIERNSMSNTRAMVIPVVVVALGNVHQLQAETTPYRVAQIFLELRYWGSAHIPRNVLSVPSPKFQVPSSKSQVPSSKFRV